MSGRRRTASKQRHYIGAAIGVLALASAGWGLYRWATSSSRNPGADPSNDGRGGKDSSRATSGSGRLALPKPGHKRPLLSLAFPLEFEYTHEQVHALAELVAALAPYYIVTPILPQHPDEKQGQGKGKGRADQALVATNELRTALEQISSFDARRTLYYSTTTGRQALAKALACDVHVETFLSPNLAGRSQGIPNEDVLGSRSDSDSSSDGESSGWQSNSEETPDDSGILIIKHGTALRKQLQYITSLTQSKGLVVLLILPHLSINALPSHLAHLPPDAAPKEHKRAIKKFARVHAKHVGTLRRTFLASGQSTSLDGQLVLLDCAPEYLRAAARRMENIDTRSVAGSDTNSTASEVWDEEYDAGLIQQAQLEDQQGGWIEAKNGLLDLRARWK